VEACGDGGEPRGGERGVLGWAPGNEGSRFGGVARGEEEDEVKKEQARERGHARCPSSTSSARSARTNAFCRLGILIKFPTRSVRLCNCFGGRGRE